MAYLELPTAMHKKSNWSNCGASCNAIIELAGADFTDMGHTDYGAAGAGALYAALTQARGNYTVLDIAIMDIHEFMVDVTPTGGYSLVNGYQMEYSAMWWCGASNQGASARGGARELVEAWGKGADIRGKSVWFAEKLRNLLACGTWGGATHGGSTPAQIWKELPFCPADTRVAHWVQTNQPVSFRIREFRLNVPVPANPINSVFYSAARTALEAQVLNVFAAW
jgi:hypothetical protein